MFKNRAFQKGLADGLLSPYRLFFGRRHRYSRASKDLITPAWADVGVALSRAILAERADVEAARTRQAARNIEQKRSA